MTTTVRVFSPGPRRFANSNWLKVPSAARFRGTALVCVLVVGVSMATRLILLARAAGSVSWHPLDLIGTLALGLVFDLITASYFAIPILLYLMVIPDRLLASTVHRWWARMCLLVAIYGLLFISVAEQLFWSEFEARFNFIAVDYLVYTTEVLGNIRESYSVPLVLGLLAFPAIGLWLVLLRVSWLDPAERRRTSWIRRWAIGFALLMLPVAATATVTNRMSQQLANRYNQEIARNGTYSFFAAFRDNQLDYEGFYVKMESLDAFRRLRGLLSADNAEFLSDDPRDITRWVTNPGPAKKHNVIQITVESLSADFMKAFGNTRNLTPNLDRIATEGILFTNVRATGTRTVRGMEALTLSLPPTPGRSIVKRDGNENLFTLGSVLRSEGYDTVFLYGGNGYFDDMNGFFEGNGYRIVDRGSRPADDVTFATAWGACDEDLFRWTLEEADRGHASGTPFFHFVMTTSNHRPFTYPEGKIDIPSGTGRDGAVKYTDYAIGEFLREARAKPWFDDTIFVIVADHTASSAGRFELPVQHFKIPLVVYNPRLFEPREVDRLSSQIDNPPTLLGMLGWSYRSRFYGRDIMRMDDGDERALLATYQKLGLMRAEQVAVLKPVREHAIYAYNDDDGVLSEAADDEALLLDTIAYYQTASELFVSGLNAAISPTETKSEILVADRSHHHLGSVSP